MVLAMSRLIRLPKPGLITRRRLIAGATASAMMPRRARAATPHRYWRVRYPDKGSDLGALFVVIQEVTMATSIGGSTVTTGGTPFASSSYNGFPYPGSGGANGAVNAYDANTGTFYNSTSPVAFDEYIGYDFGAGNEKDIVDVRLAIWPGFGGSIPGWAVVEYSDDNVTYTPYFGIQPFSQPTTSIGSNVIAGFAGGFQYYRLLITGTQGAPAGGQTVIQYIQFNGPVVGDPYGFAFTAREVLGDSQLSATQPPTGVVDNSVIGYVNKRLWSSDTATTDHWISFDFGPGNKPIISQIKMTDSHSAPDINLAPKTFTFQASNDGSTWTNLQSYTADPWTVVNQVQTFTVNPYTSAASPRGRIWD